MARWRDTKQGKPPKQKKSKKQDKPQQAKESLPFASNIDKAKAFLTDSFMILMPVMYIIIYVGFGNLQNVAQHRGATWAAVLGVLGLIVVLLYTIKGQTPGLKAYNLKVIDIQTKKKPSFISSLLRYLFFTLNFFTVIGLGYSFFRDDKRGVHDLLSGTAIVYDTKTDK